MESRSLLVGFGAGLLLATLIIGGASTLVPAASAPPITPTPSTDWKAEALKSGMVVLAQTELDQQLKQAHDEGAKQKETELSGKPEQVQTIHVYIQPGMGTTDVAWLLQASGVVEDGNQLIALREKGSASIRAGVYDLPLKGDPQAVFKVITTPPTQ
ncbi:hypothetical protein [Tumebacillus permanentifrigoris]|uniref:Uncharacterized protein n=1 Tax=Tumebacillus permanentifrigoris TaxID=378543 RepID=A0A316DUF1_9BACL|nr:hypothetical protein [Tumebacillus permanentifrigoris]PWK12682.1 hypothetical protein C7459_10934 [Tumebacillus permanentifrigoris]